MSNGLEMSQNNSEILIKKLLSSLSKNINHEFYKVVDENKFEETKGLLNEITALEQTEPKIMPAAFICLQAGLFKLLQRPPYLTNNIEIEHNFKILEQLVSLMNEFNMKAWSQLANPEAWSYSQEFNLFVYAIKLDLQYVKFFEENFPNELTSKLENESSAKQLYEEAIRCNKLSIFNYFSEINSTYLEQHLPELLNLAIEVSNIEFVQDLLYLASVTSTNEIIKTIQSLDNFITKYPSKDQAEDETLKSLLGDSEQKINFPGIFNRAKRLLAEQIKKNIQEIPQVKRTAKSEMKTQYNVEKIQENTNKKVKSYFENIEKLLQLSSSLHIQIPSDIDVFHQSICYGDEEVLEFFINKYPDAWEARIRDEEALKVMIELAVRSFSLNVVQYFKKKFTLQFVENIPHLIKVALKRENNEVVLAYLTMEIAPSQSKTLLETLNDNEKISYLKGLLSNIQINQGKIKILLSGIRDEKLERFVDQIRVHFKEILSQKPYTAQTVKEIRALCEIKLLKYKDGTSLFSILTNQLEHWDLEYIIQHADYDDYLFFGDLLKRYFGNYNKFFLQAAVINGDINIFSDLLNKYDVFKAGLIKDTNPISIVDLMKEAVRSAQMDIIKYLEPLMTQEDMYQVFNINRMEQGFIDDLCQKAVQKGDIEFFRYLESQCNKFNKGFQAWTLIIKPKISKILTKKYEKRDYPFTEPSKEMVEYLDPYIHAVLKSKLHTCTYDNFFSALIIHKLKNIPEKLSIEDCEIYSYLNKSKKTRNYEFFDFPITKSQQEDLCKHPDFKKYQTSLQACKDGIKDILECNIKRIENTDSYWNVFFSSGECKVRALRFLASQVEESLTIPDIRELLDKSLNDSIITKVRSIDTSKIKSIQAIEDCISILDNIHKNDSDSLTPSRP